jgi:hypothetical protein
MKLLNRRGRPWYRRAAAGLAWGVMVVLLSVVSDPTAAGREPSHGHVVIGNSVLEAARALRAHTHEPAPAQPHACPHPIGGTVTVAPRATDGGSAATPGAVKGGDRAVVISTRGPITSATVWGLNTGAVLHSHWEINPAALSVAPVPEFSTVRWQAPDESQPTPPPKAS